MGGSITYLKIINNPITSFCGGMNQPMGMVELMMEFGNWETRDSKAIKSLFNIIDLSLTYNGIIRRPILYKINAAISIRWLIMKIPLEGLVIIILRDQSMAK